MRVTQGMMVKQFLKNIGGINEKLLEYQFKVARGVNYSKPSDGPLAIGHILSFKAQEQKIAQYQKNIANGLSQVEYMDTLMQSMITKITDARTDMVYGANDSLGPADRGALALNMDQYLQSILEDSQSLFRDRYIFSGYETMTNSFIGSNSKWDGFLGSVNYIGDLGKIHRRIGDLNRLQFNINGKEMFLEQTYTLKGDYLPVDKPMGFSGKLTINDKTIIVNNTHTLEDVRDMINDEDGIKVMATTDSGYLKLESTTSSEKIEISDNQNGVLLDDLGLNLRGAFNRGITAPTMPVIDSTGAIFDAAGAVANLTYDDTNNILNLHLGPNANDGVAAAHSIVIPQGTYADAAELADAIQNEVDIAFGADKILVEDIAGTLRLSTVETGASIGTADLQIGGEIDGTLDSASDSADLNLIAAPDPAPLTNSGTAGTDGTDKFFIDINSMISRTGENPEQVEVDLRAANTGTLSELIDELNYQFDHEVTLRGVVRARENNGRVLIETVKTGHEITADALQLTDSTTGTLTGLGLLEDPTLAHIDGVPIAAFPVTITAGVNDTMEIDLGASVSYSGLNLDPITITLRDGAYADINALASEINTQFASDAELFGSISATVEGPPGAEYISISSFDDGSDVRGVDLAITDGTALADLGFVVGTAIDGGGTSEGKGIKLNPQNIFNTLIETRDSLLGIAEEETLLSGLTNQDGEFTEVFDGDIITFEEEGRSYSMVYRTTDTLEDLIRAYDEFLGTKAKVSYDRSGRLVIENTTTRKITGLKISAANPDGVERETFNSMFETETDVLGFHSISTDGLLDPTRSDKVGEEYLGLVDLDMDNFLQHQAFIGATANRFERTSTLLMNKDFNVKSDRADIESANIAEVIMALGEQEALLNAALNVGSRVLTMSLLDYLR
ncbi:hypothetical protein J7L05_03445 [bacterium]|nr:hypothetical protein [bacterium]